MNGWLDIWWLDGWMNCWLSGCMVVLRRARQVEGSMDALA